MTEKIYKHNINLNWDLINKISQIDRFDASWSSNEDRDGQLLEQLKSEAIVKSIGASMRLEGSKLSNAEVDSLLKNKGIDRLNDREAQAVAGYLDVLDIITESHEAIAITESSIKGLHNALFKYNKKDQWHKGDYKQVCDLVEATLPDGTKQKLFETTPPGHLTDNAMGALINWYEKDQSTHPLAKCAIFTYEFLSIHPFQDGNGRLSRLLSLLLLLKHGYDWIQYVSFEHEMENQKTEYYKVLRSCQAQRPNEEITSWVKFYLDVLLNIQEKLLHKFAEKLM